jgi:hypothetical protein
MTEAESFLWQRIRRKQLKGRQLYKTEKYRELHHRFLLPFGEGDR